MHRRRRRLCAPALLLLLALLSAVTAALPSTGAAFTARTAASATFSAWVPVILTQPADTAACTSLTGSGPCTDGRALSYAAGLAVTGDGTSVYVASYSSNAVAAFGRSSTTGFLTQLSGTSGCVQTADTQGCTLGPPLDETTDVAVSADGSHLYALSEGSNAVVAFLRGADGGLTRVAGTAGCLRVIATGSPACALGKAMLSPTSVTVSPDGGHVYVLSKSTGGISVNARSAGTGGLTALSCVHPAGNDNSGNACTTGRGTAGAGSLAFTSDSAYAYVASRTTGSVTAFARDAGTGALNQLAGTAGCISDTGDSGACVDGVALWGASDVAVSPDLKHVYVTAAFSDAVAAFSRDLSTGQLTQLAGTAACVSNDGSSGACVDGNALDGASSLAVSPDGAYVFVASTVSNSLSVFRRNATTGALTQATGVAGCLSSSASGCTLGRALNLASSVVVSPDGKDVYVASAGSSAVALFTTR